MARRRVFLPPFHLMIATTVLKLTAWVEQFLDNPETVIEFVKDNVPNETRGFKRLSNADIGEILTKTAKRLSPGNSRNYDSRFL